MRVKRRNRFRTGLFTIICLMICTVAQAAQPSKVLILPFNVYSEKDLSFLKNGIQDMLASRLAKEGEVVPLTKETANEAVRGISDVNEQVAKALGGKLGADYVVYGSLTVFGHSLSTDAKILDMAQGKTALAFSDSGKDNGDVISHVNRFAAQVNDRIFGRPAETVRPAAPEKKAVEESRRHPESLWTGKIDTEEERSVTGKRGPARLGAAWRSRNFKMEIRSIALGDVDGDGNIEIAFTDEKQVLIYRYTNERFIKIGVAEGVAQDRFLSVDVADINGNGKAEIFVTNINKNNKVLRSFVLEWSGTRFQKISEDARWYYRVLDMPGRGRVLMGQRRGAKAVFLPGVEELRWNNGQYVAANAQALPRWANIYSFNYGDILDNGQTMTLAFTEQNYLRVLDPDGKEEWESPEGFGGSATYLEYPDDAASSIGDYKKQNHLYLAQRILVADADKDGKTEVIVSKNKDAAGGLFSRLRLFKGGHVECLIWDNFGLYTKWKTREVSGYLSDYALADIDNDGENELVFSVVKKKSSVIGDARSFIAAQDIRPPSE